MNAINRNWYWIWTRIWRTALVMAIVVPVIGGVVPLLILAHNPFPPSNAEVYTGLLVTGTIGIAAIWKLRHWLNGTDPENG